MKFYNEPPFCEVERIDCVPTLKYPIAYTLPLCTGCNKKTASLKVKISSKHRTYLL